MFKKVILSPLGELTHEERTIGDTIRYRIYYDKVTRPEATIVISDKLDENLSKVKVSKIGHYDKKTHTITWEIKETLLKRRTFVEFEAVIGPAKVIRNQAFLIGPEERRKGSNIVETTVVRPPTLGWIPFVKSAEPGAPPRVCMKDETTMGTTVRFDFPGVFVYDERVDGVTYQHFSIPGWATCTDEGKPELPVAGDAIEVPFDVSFMPEIIKAETMVLKGYNVYPAQPSPIARSTDPEPFVLDAATYLADTNFPSKLAVAADEDIGIIRGHRILFLKINPIQYNPVTKVITAHPMIEVRLNYSHPAQLKGVNRRIRSSAFEEMLKGTVLNYKDPDRFTAGGDGENTEKNGCDYLIIAADIFYNEKDPNDPIVRLRDWKQRKGYITKVVKVGSVTGGNTENAIKTYIQNAYNQWNPAPSYVLFVGDSDIVRSHLGHDHPHEIKYNQPPLYSDLFYAKVDGTDYFPDIFIGRLPVDNQQQLTDVVNKILSYEQTPPATPANNAFYTNASLISLCQDTYDTKTVPNGRESFPWIATVESIRQYLLTQNYAVERIYATNSGFPPAGPNTPSPIQYMDGTGLPNDLLSPQYGWNGGAADITNAFNNGRFLFSYLAHGAPGSWGHPGLSIADINALNQNDLTPVVFSITCQTGWFDNEIDDDTRGGRGTNDDSFAEALLRQPRAGAVAVVAQTRVSYVYWNGFIELGMFKAVWPAFSPAPPWSSLPSVPAVTPPRLLRMGQIVNFGKMFMAKAYGPGDKREVEFEMGHLFGDPEMPVWTQVPGRLKVEHPKGVGSTGRQDFVVRVTDDTNNQVLLNATVVLTRTNKILQVRQTNASGLARFDLNSIGSGNIDITVTMLNYRPYMGVIAAPSGGAVLDPFNPTDGPEGDTIHLGGKGFKSSDKVDLSFGDKLLTTADASNSGEFGQGGTPVDVKVPLGYPHGLANVSASNKAGDRYAVRLYQLRDKNPVDLWTYDQWDSSTWSLHPGDNPTWDSPDILLYDRSGAEVASDNLVVQEPYTVKVKVHNKEAFTAKQAKVTFKWRNYGTDGVWELFDPNPVATVDVPANPPGEATAQNSFTPPTTGHLCILVEIEHLEDTKITNNMGQENLHVGYSNSPTEVCFLVWNLTEVPAPVHLEVRQLIKPGMEKKERLWATWIKHPDPQILQPGHRGKACVIVDPDPADVRPGTRAEFAVTAFVGGKMVGGVNAIITKK